MFGNVWIRSGGLRQLLENLQKSSESGRKSSENHFKKVSFSAFLQGERVTLVSGLTLAGGQKKARIYKQNLQVG